ncbi:cellulose synthase-like protein E1 [Arachis ipaensis]|uniref:cellulose synthase-like protein E1 n=1 Tax=Arachis ipaensis TaxID=130454 RepID=UPI000A2B29B8|nr:cellulose synthase-like protein E1 [Arachis ipaensis]
MGKNEESHPLFETRRAKGIFIHRIFSFSMFLGILFIWVYRVSYMPRKSSEDGKWVWVGMFLCELWFGLYWLMRLSLRWNPVFRQPFSHTLSQRYDDDKLPGVDIFVCTADPKIEPPMMVINTVLSVMAYDYPTHKLSVYLSDDGGSDITFYALLEASNFAKHWLPFCKKFNVEPRSPAAYFKSISSTAYSDDSINSKELVIIKKLYEDMESRIENAGKSGEVPEEIRSKNKRFSQWDSFSSRRDHDAIIQVCLFIRVSSIISNGKIILNVDCDMYSNNAQSLKEALCFLIDEEKGHEIAFVQTPQGFENLTKNDIYGGALRVIYEWEFPGMDGFGGPMYIGSGCFHKRDTLCGRKFNDQESLKHWNGEDINNDQSITKTSLHLLEEKSKALLSCTYENNTLWGKEMGLLYGCAVEDVITGLAIQCRGWKSVYYNPKRKAFLGVSPTTLPEALVQHKRWSEGGFQILLSKYSAAWCAYGLISPGLQITYCFYNLWVLNCLPTLYYSIFPSLCLLKGISLFPQMSSPWFIPYAYVTLGENTQCLLEFLWSEGTIKGYWNDLRMWLYKRTSSYLFALIDTIFKSLGFSSLDFVISAKVAEENVSQRYKKEIMEFGNSSPMLTLLATLALFNLFCLVGALFKGGLGMLMVLPLQVLLSVVLVLINLPLYEGLFLRKDKGRFPTSVVFKSMAVALSACVLSNVNVFTII